MSLQDSACSKDNSIFAKPFQTGGLFPKPKHHSSKKNAHEEKIATYIAKILSNDKDQELEGLTGIRKLLSIADNPPIQQVVDSGVVPKILSFMSPSEGPVFQFEAAWTITNICSGTSQHVQYIVELGGVDATLALLDSTSTEVLEQAVWTLGNIAGDNVEYRNICLEKNSMDRLLTVLVKSQFHTSLQRNAIWAMSNLVRSKPTPPWQDIYKGVIAFIQILTIEEFDEVFIDALWAISWVSEAYIQEMINYGCVPLLVRHLKNEQLSLIVPALRALGNIVTGNDEQTNTVVSHPDFLPRVFELTSNSKTNVRKEAFWLLSNVAAGTSDQIELILKQHKSMEKLQHGLIKESPETSIEAAWAIGNLASNATEEQIANLVNTHNYLELIKFMLHVNSVKMNEIGLEAALNVLGAGEDDDSSAENPYINLFKQKGLVKKIKALSVQPNLLSSVEGILVYFDGSEGEEFFIEPEYEPKHKTASIKQNLKEPNNRKKIEEPKEEESSAEDEDDDEDDYESEVSSDSDVEDEKPYGTKKKITNCESDGDSSNAETNDSPQKQPDDDDNDQVYQNLERED